MAGGILRVRRDGNWVDAVAQVTKDKNKVFLASGPGSSDLTVR